MRRGGRGSGSIGLWCHWGSITRWWTLRASRSMAGVGGPRRTGWMQRSYCRCGFGRCTGSRKPGAWFGCRLRSKRMPGSYRASWRSSSTNGPLTATGSRAFWSARGAKVKLGADFLLQLEQTRLWDGRALPPHLKERIQREHKRLTQVQEQIQELEKQRQQAVAERATQ